MTRKNLVMVAAVLGGSLALVGAGCSSDSSGCADGGDAACTTTKDGAIAEAASTDSAADGPVLFGFSAGDSCFVVTAVAPGSVDGCDLGVASAATNDPTMNLPLTIPFNYTVDPTTAVGVVKLGTFGGLGQGAVSNNMGTLLRDGMTADTMMPTCTWQQTDTSQMVVTANNTFMVSVSETESGFAAACSAPPAGGTCTSTWTWTMTKSTTMTYPNCGI